MQFVVPGALVLLGLYAVTASIGLGLWQDGEPGAGFFPFIFAAVLGVSGLLQVAAGRPASQTGRVDRRKLGIYLAALVLYVALFETLGFIVSTAAVFALVMIMAEGVPPLRAAAVSAAALTLGYLVLQRFLGVPLPPGILK